MKIQPKNWTEFQHYRDRKPPWIKLHRTLLDDSAYQRLPTASKALAPMLWLLASEHETGVIDADPEELGFRLRMAVSEVEEALGPLIGKGFFIVVQFASAALAVPEHVAIPETEGETEAETETPLVPLARDGSQSKKRKAQVKTEALQYLDFLNAKAGKHFRPVPSTLRFIEARLAEGISLQDLKTLTVRKCREWLGTDQEKFLRPETLCNATKCHSYLGEIPPEVPCNVPDAIAASSPPKNLAPAAGPRPTASPSTPPSTRTVGDVLGSLGWSDATMPVRSPTEPEAKALGSAATTSSAETPLPDNESLKNLEAGPVEPPCPYGAGLH